MNKTFDLQTSAFDGANALRLYLHYDKGNGWNRRRGYYLGVRPVEIEEKVYNGVTIQSVGFVGVDDRAKSFFLSESARFNRRIFEMYVERVEQNKEKILAAWEKGDYSSVWDYV